MTIVCVGISFYNAEKYLDYAIKSVLNQTYTNWKMILIDDGSTDSSLALARKYSNDTRVEVISDGQNKGLVYRLNQLVKLCNSMYFVRMDADDIMHPQRLEKQLRYLMEYPQIDVVGSWAYSIDVENKVIGILKNKENPSKMEDVFAHSCFIHPTIMGKKEWFENNPYDSRFIRMEDMELWCRTIEYSKFHNLPEPLLFYREVGIPYLSKYLSSMNGERKLIRKVYKEKAIRKYIMLMKTWIKSIVYIAFTFFRLQNVLIKNRANKMNDTFLQKASQDLLSAVAS